MRTCEEYEALISALLDGALADEDRAELMAHMAGCPACQAYFDDQIAIREALAGMEVQAPEGFTDRVMAEVRREAGQLPENGNRDGKRERKTVAFPYWRRYAAMAACCAVVAIAGFWAFNGAQPSTGNVAADTVSLMDSRSAPVAEDQEAAAAGSGGTADAAGDAGADTGTIADQQTVPADSGEQTAPETGAAEERDVGEPETFSAATTEPEKADRADPVQHRGDVSPELYGAEEPGISTASTTAGAVTLTTDSALAEAWVSENLGETWEAGASYTLTVEQFDQVQALLQANGESFLLSIPTEEPPANTALDAEPEETEDGQDGAEEPAASGEDVPAEESGDAVVTYVLQAAP